MRIRFRLFMFVLVWAGFLLCFYTQARTWKELLTKADSLSDAADYDSAIVITQMALKNAETQLSESDTTIARFLYRLGVYHLNLGDYDPADSLLKQALTIWEKSNWPDHPEAARILNRLGTLKWEQGKYAEAEQLYQRALFILDKALGPNHPDVTRVLNNLAILYADQGKYAQAEPIYKQVLSVLEKNPKTEPTFLAAVLDNLAILYHYQAKYAEAEPLYRRAWAVREKAVGADHPFVAYSLNNLAILQADQGKYVEAEALLKRALTIWEKAFGRSHINTAESLTSLANIYRELNKNADAESLYQQTLTIQEKHLGSFHPYVAKTLHNMALLYRNKKDFVNSKKSAQRAYSIRRTNFRDGSAVLSEKDALTYSKFMRDEANLYISILLDSKDTTLNCRKEIADVIFSTKGQVSDGIFARHKTQVYEKNPKLKVLSDSLRNARFKLANLYVEGPSGQNPEDYRRKLIKASEEKERLEAELARQSADFRRESELWEVNVPKVVSALPAKSVLVEYMKYDRLKTSRETEPHYLLVVADTKGEIFISDLGSSDQIDSLVTIYRSHFKDISTRGGSPFLKDLQDYRRIAGKLYERIWKPVEDKLPDADLVFIAPDGALNLVSFAGLTDGVGKYLIESYPIQYLSSGRDLIRLREEIKLGRGLFALGDPDFDASASARLASAGVPAETRGSGTSFETLRNVRSACEDLGKIRVLPLPGSRQEIEKIALAWKERTKDSCWVLLGANASEENFKRNAPGKKVVHMATHGYYAPYQREASLRKYGMSETFVGENPLLLSGLFLAGANLHGVGAESLGVEDGILTAEEVTGMDLEGTKWVVLSACESGLGEVKSGEGVYGLRRAFQMAGARTVISALWPVSDKTTSEMMSYLYDYKENNLALAIQSLAKKNLEGLRRKNQPDHPYLWAAFIALGDWR